MRTFVISGTFEAENIIDAFEWLAQHFAALAEYRDDDESRLCHIHIWPAHTELDQTMRELRAVERD